MTKWPVRLLLIAFFFLFPQAYGQAQQSNKSLLWRISSKEMKQPSFLFGTIHLICPADYTWTDKMQQSLKQAEAICLEMDMDAPGIYQQIALGMVDTSGKTLKDYFTEEEYKLMARYMADSMGMDIAVFAKMKPAALQTMLVGQSFDCENPVSYENNIMQEAQHDKKEILGLEMVAEQLDLFDNLPADSVVKELLELVQGKDESKEDYSQLVAAYKNQDLPALHELIQKSGAKDFDLGGFLDTRNEKWVPRMVEKMDQRAIFFAVGAGHLWGENGLISLLRKQGYVVEPIK
jgi:uncharacterized protein YbaP (TraB family)